MGAAPLEANSIATLPDQELFDRYSRDPSNKTLGDELYKRCIARIERVVKMYAFRRRLCPPQDRNGFIVAAMSKAAEKLASRIRWIQSAQKLNTLAIELARDAALEEYRLLRRRGITWQRSTTPKFRSKHYRDPLNFLITKDEGLVNALLTIHAEGSKRDTDSALWIRNKLEENYTVGDIATERGTPRLEVWDLLDHDSKELQRILEEEFNIPIENF